VKNLALVVHGGAGAIPSELKQACKNGLLAGLDRGWNVLQIGGSALDACEQAIIQLENDPLFDAGIGSHLNRDGHIQMDAILMDGSSLKSGAVVAVERVCNPIRLARLVLDRSEHMLLAGAGAELFAHENGLSLCDPSELITDREAQIWSDKSGKVANFGTVGAVALDANGNVASGTSTGGTLYKYPGRVGDSALVGCGCYADNSSGAISCTGHGESIMKLVLAKTASEFILSGKSPQEAAAAAVSLLGKRTAGRGGLIVVDREGRIGTSFSTPDMAYAFKTNTTSGIFDIGP
jgi:L-asparaginase / beta-aspartyl-peptidase